MTDHGPVDPRPSNIDHIRWNASCIDRHGGVGMFGILGWIIFGLIVGVIAKLLMPGKDPGGMIVTILLGIVGAILGGYAGRAMGLYGTSRQRRHLHVDPRRGRLALHLSVGGRRATNDLRGRGSRGRRGSRGPRARDATATYATDATHATHATYATHAIHATHVTPSTSLPLPGAPSRHRDSA